MSCKAGQFGWGRQVVKYALLTMLAVLGQVVGLAQSVSMAWNPSTSTNVAGYKIYYGTISQTYTSSIAVGNVTNATVSGLNAGTTYYFAATTYDSSGNESGFSNEASYAIPLSSVLVMAQTNQPPTLDPIADFFMVENGGTQSVNLSGITSGSTNETQTLTISAISSNPALIPNPAVNYSSPNATGVLSFAPLANTFGQATITVTVNDGGASNNIVTQSFVVTVNAVNQAPTLNPLANLSIAANAGLQTVNLSGITSGAVNENQKLTVSAISSNPALVPTPAINYTSPNSTGTLTFAPQSNVYGKATITVTVNDGGASNNIATQSFTVTVAAPNRPPTLNAIANLSINENSGPRTIALSGLLSGATNENQTLIVTAASSNPALIPAPVINYTSPGKSGALIIAPATNAYGTAIITVTVNDGGANNNSIARSFVVTVNAVNQPPTLNPIPNLTIAENAGRQVVALSGISAGAPNELQLLRLMVSSSNPNLIKPAVVYASPATHGILTFKPAMNATGVAVITVTVNDGGRVNNTTTQKFTVNVVATNQVAAVANVANPVFDTPATLTPLAAAAGQFSFTVSGVAGNRYVVEASSDLIQWTAIQTNTAPFKVVDSNVGSFPQRFYRTHSL